MVKVTLSVSKEIKDKLSKFPEVDWPEVLRAGIKDKIAKLNKFEKTMGEL